MTPCRLTEIYYISDKPSIAISLLWEPHISYLKKI